MRVLVLVESAADLDFEGQLPRLSLLEPASPRRDLATVLTQLDPQRIQLHKLALTGSSPQSLRALGWFDWTACWRLIKFLRQHEIELIHGLGPRAAFYAALVGRLIDLPTIATLYEFTPGSMDNMLRRWILSLRSLIMRRGLDRIIVPSDQVRLNMWQLSYPKTRISIVYPAVAMHPEIVPPPNRQALGLPDDPLVTIVAPLEPDQGFKTIFDALPYLLERVPDVHLAVVGDGSLARELHQRTRMRPVFWLGRRDDIRDIIAASRVIVVHPQHPCLPIVILEAGAAGIPVVSSRVGGVYEIVEHAVTGLMVTTGDAHDLGIQISRLLLQPNFAHTLGVALRRRVREWCSLPAQIDLMMRIYEETIYGSR